MSEQANTTADPLTRQRGTCTLCGVPISSATALRCVACERKCTRHCPECMEPDRGGKHRLRSKYMAHEDRGPRAGEMPCRRCGLVHAERKQLVCQRCGNDRFILEVPADARTPA